MRIAIVTNILTPYRKSFYKELSAQLKEKNGELKVFALTESLPLRPWTFENLKEDCTELVPGRKVFIKNEDYLFNHTINKVLLKFKPDIVIIAGSWTYPALWKILLHKKRNTRYFFWTESHNNRATKVGTSNLFILKLKQTFYRKFDGFCVPGKYANETVDYLIGKQGIRIKLPNLVDNEFYSYALKLRENKNQLRKKYSLPIDKVILICPARLIAIKGIDIFIKNVAACKDIGRVVFVIAGDGPEKQKIIDVAKEGYVDVRLLGYCDQNKVRELYALADAFWLPSLQDANPLTSIEAAFSGLPLIVSKYTGNSPELVQEKVNGVIFDTVDKQSVTDAMDYILSRDSNWFIEAGEKSYEVAKKEFECATETKKLIEQFEHVKNVL